MTYKDYLLTSHWSSLKQRKESSKEKGCAFCGIKENIELYHLFYRKKWEDTEIGDLRWLCSRCHDTVHRLEEEGKIIKNYTTPPCANEIFLNQRKAVFKKLKIRPKKTDKFGDPKVYKHNRSIPRSRIEQQKQEFDKSKKGVVRKIKIASQQGEKTKNVRRYGRDMRCVKYLKRCEKRDFVLTKRAIAELSPWTIQMVKIILKHDIVNIQEGLKELFERGATVEELWNAFSVSPIFERLATLNYGQKREF